MRVYDEGEPFPEHDRVGLTLDSELMNREVWVPFMTPSELTADRIMLAVETVLQSNQEWLFNAPMSLRIVHALLPAGGGKNDQWSTEHIQHLNQKRSIITIKDAIFNTCCPRAIQMGVYSADGDKKMVKKCSRRPKFLHTPALELCARAGVRIGVSFFCTLKLDTLSVGLCTSFLFLFLQEECGPREWKLFQKALGTAYDLVVVSADYFNSIVFRGNPGGKKQVCIYHVQRHYHTITTLRGFLDERHICPHCLKGYSRPGDHKYVSHIVPMCSRYVIPLMSMFFIADVLCHVPAAAAMVSVNLRNGRRARNVVFIFRPKPVSMLTSPTVSAKLLKRVQSVVKYTRHTILTCVAWPIAGIASSPGLRIISAT